MAVPNTLIEQESGKVWHPIWDYGNGWYLLLSENHKELRQVVDYEITQKFKGQNRIGLDHARMGVRV